MQLPAADGDALLVQFVEGLLALLADLDQPGFAQDGQVMRDRRLGDVQPLDDLVDREPIAAAEFHDLLPGLIGQGFGEKDRVECCHIDNRLFDII